MASTAHNLKCMELHLVYPNCPLCLPPKTVSATVDQALQLAVVQSAKMHGYCRGPDYFLYFRGGEAMLLTHLPLDKMAAI